MNIYLQNSLLLDKNRFVASCYKILIRFALYCTASSLQLMVEGEGNIAHLRTRSCCGKYNSLNAAKMPYAMLPKCPIYCENALRRCKNALNMLRRCSNFMMHIIIIIIIIIVIIH